MVSKMWIITVLCAIDVISNANGVIGFKLQGLKPILECYEEKAPEFAGAKALAERLNLDSGADDLKLSCLVVKESATCLADVLENTPAPIPKDVLFYIAETYQTAYLLEKANLCSGIKYDDLKRIVSNTGIMEEEGLSNIEDDVYHKCAGDAIKKCVIESMHVFDHEQGDPEEVDDADDAYIRCLEQQAKTTCNNPIMRHFYEEIEAYKKHVKQLVMLEAEEQQG